MRRLLTGFFVLIGLAIPALAQQAAYVYTALGYQQITPVPSGTTLTLPTGTAGGTQVRMVQICVETNSVRYRDDGTTPTTTVGMLLEPAAAGFDGCMMYSGPLSVLQFTQVTSPATLDVSYYR